MDDPPTTTNQELDLKCWSDDPAAPLPLVVTHPHIAAQIARENGAEYGYPACCVDQFAHDLEHGRLPAQLRGSVALEMGGYVPCSRCRAELEAAR
jgi:hypothetical protein